MKKFVFVNGQEVEWEEQMTLRRLLEKIPLQHRLFVVKIDGKIQSKKEYSVKIIPEKARVWIIPLLSGG
jgi:thiamine biosynthesis protein ThiS